MSELRSDGEDESHRLSMTVLMTPDMSNFRGNVHGGIVLK
jgi:acyl-CoA hydrolase